MYLEHVYSTHFSVYTLYSGTVALHFPKIKEMHLGIQPLKLILLTELFMETIQMDALHHVLL